MGLFNFKTQYQPLAGNNDNHTPSISPRLRQYSLGHYLLLFMAITVSAGIGGFIGRKSADCGRCGLYSNPAIPLGTSKEVFVYNRTFGADPQTDSATEAAWDSLVPVGQGSVRYPAGSKDVYTLSVVHQLHCLWSIHQNYYGISHTGHSRKDDHISPHMRHCFDYLRQSLMCAADSTLEPVDSRLGGVTGWGNERVCRDYAALAEWAEKRRVSNGRGFSDHDSSKQS
ncbi:hypothetical protein FQN49_000912 [Arthroderma sp. PD_2]|nr:hypothetical protein FQN49_000912 [Arthroderma sp. PD_2]